MIESITLKDVASYHPTNEVKITNLKKVNFFFGYNGSGKSTIARYLYNLTLYGDERTTDFAFCKQSGFDDSSIQILVFDEKFIERNFITNKTQPGIFSLNEENEEIDKLIEIKEGKLKELQNHKDTVLKNRETTLLSDRKQNEDKLKENCFEKRKETIKSFIKLKDSFPFKQHQNNYDNLKKIIDENPELNETNFDNLVNDYNTYYEKELKRIENKVEIDKYRNIRRIERQIKSVLQEVIIGNKDVDIAKMIDNLGIRSWVDEGREKLHPNKEIQICPFCQKETIDKDLINKFEQYFDETYQRKINEIERLKTEYEKEMVTGTFENKDAPGLDHTFSHGYNGIIKKFKFFDGKESTVPRYIAQHLNNCLIRDTEPEFNDRGLIIGQKVIMRKRFNFFNQF